MKNEIQAFKKKKKKTEFAFCLFMARLELKGAVCHTLDRVLGVWGCHGTPKPKPSRPVGHLWGEILRNEQAGMWTFL